MFLTSYLLIRYWLFNRDIIKYFEIDHKNLKKIVNNHRVKVAIRDARNAREIR